MESSDPLELSQQGNNLEAIATLIKRSLQTEDITVKTSLKDDCLQILLESSQIPNEQNSVNLIRRELQLLNADFFTNVKISGRQTGERIPAWTEEFGLEQIQNPASEAETIAKSVTSDREFQTIASSSDVVAKESMRQRIKSSEFVNSLRTFRFSAVVPYREAFSPSLYSHGMVKLLLFFSLFPLAVGLLADQTGLAVGLKQTAWILGIYYASIWGVVLQNLIRPVQFSWSDTFKCIVFTLFVGIPLLLFFQQVPPFSLLYAATDWGLIPQLIGFVLGVGVLEELTKALPVYLLLLRSGKLSDPLTAAFYGTMSGLGFAISEGVVYSARYALGLVVGIAEGEADFGGYVLANTIRLVSLPLFHAIWAGIVGYFMGLAAINPARKTAIIFIGVAIAAVLHGLYNTFAGGLLGLAVMAFSILLFVAYLRRSQKMVDEMQQAELSRKANL
jgi:protease PrsW